MRFPTCLRTPLFGVSAALLISGAHVQAVPYASSLTNDSGVISFRLNAPADSVRVLYNDGANSVDLGALPRGLTVTNLGITGIFSVEVQHDSGPGFLQGVVNQVSVDTNRFVQFVNQRGLVVNNNPASPYFGRVYVSVATAATVASNAFTMGTRPLGIGIYAINADQTDALGQGDTPRTGGLTFGGGEGPYRLFIGPDDNLYIADWSDSRGGLNVTDANIATNATATNVLAGIGGPTPPIHNHGSIYGVHVEGTLAGGDLTVWTGDEDMTPLNSVWRYDIGSGPLPHEGPPSLLFSHGITTAAQVAKVMRGPDGKWYKSQRRADYATSSGLFAISEDGASILWSSIAAWRAYTGNATANDVYFSETRGFAVSPDGKYLATIKGATNLTAAPYNAAANTVIILPMHEGIPNITNMIIMPTQPTTSIGREVAFDLAGNLYTVSSGQQLLRIYAPGGYSTATTGSDGTFELIRPPDVSVEATVLLASEEGPVNGEFTFTRSGNASGTLTVNYTVSGTATPGADYAALPGTVTFQSAESSVTVPVQVINDTEAEFPETVEVTLTADESYSLGIPASASVVIQDNETPELTITTLIGTMYERVGDDYATFRITRKGDTNQYVVVAFTYSGQAVSGVDYIDPGAVAINPGEITVNFNIHPIDNSLAEGNKIITIGLTPGGDFVVGSPGSASVTLVDDDFAPELVLFSDDFDTDTSANWTTRAGAVNGVEDYHAVFNYDYAGKGIPPAPGGFTTWGLIATANKRDTNAFAAGVNLYPSSQNFSGNYALRFQMFIEGVSGAATTEHVLFGINHSGNNVNYASRVTTGTGFADNSPGGGDGIWFNIVADNSDFPGGGGYGAIVSVGTPPTVLASRSIATTADIFKAPPYRFTGTPASFSSLNRKVWVDVEVKQVDDVITLLVNNSEILSFTNTTSFKSGKVMLGYNDAFGSVGGGNANTSESIDQVQSGFVVFDNVRVIRVGPPHVSRVQITGGNVVIDFSDSSAGPWTVRAANSVTGTYDPVAATITTLSPGSYRATVPYNPAQPQRYFRIQR